MYTKDHILRMLFLDIETARYHKDYEELSEGMKKMWELKAQNIDNKEQTLSIAEKYYDRAAIYAEFARVICISVGFIYERNGEMFLRTKSFFGANEKHILEDFRDFIDEKSELSNDKFKIQKTNSSHKFNYLVAHNGKEFDFPFLGRRFLVNQLKLPLALELRGKKPWEIHHLIDTMELWKFGDSKNFTKLELLCNIFDIPTPKDDIDGSQVGEVFWKDEDYERIAVYCEKDVIATAQLILKYNLLPLIPESHIQFTERKTLL
ncbi:MAG: ribonuclease H-like domain-containing protein [Thermonemataceae bacterium]|nr:ribonuclease H-like domain-containing protein [Thermonemataceae bacterium]